MGTAPQLGRDTNWAESLSDAVLVREQLRRLVAHPLFTNSKRYPVLLTYAVEQTLLGNASELKERTIGVEAFGREPDYDVSLDPVVRITAAEVRKRLSQYYYDPDHAGELVIELPVGSYVPSVHEPAHPTGFAEEAVHAQEMEAPPQDPVAPSLPPASAGQQLLRLVAHRSTPIVIALFFAALIGFAVGRARFPAQHAKPPTDMERFWKPFTATSSRVTYCLGEPTEAVDLQSGAANDGSTDGSLNVYDVVTLANSIVPLVSQNSAYRVVAAPATEFAQLREGPFVLIGAFDNPWTMRITQDLPLGFEYDNRLRKLVDRKSIPKRSWTLRWEGPNTKLAEDYALVARIHDNVTGQPVIILAGILGEGTEAASEVVSNPVYLKALLESAPKNWDQQNLEAVIKTTVIEGHPGPPTVVDVETW